MPPHPVLPPESTAHVTRVGPYQVHWLEYGSGPSAVALVHGLSGSCRWWARNIRALATRRRVLVPDVIGFGGSRLGWAARRRLPRVPELAAALGDWLNEAAGGRPVDLVGHSMGGQLCIHLTASRPAAVGRLVLVDATGLRRPLTPRNVARFAYEVAPPARWGDPAFLPVILGDAVTAGPRVLLTATRHLLMDDVEPLLPRVAAPTLLLWGEGDTLVPAEHGRRMREAIPGSRLLVLPGAFHNPMVDAPDAFNRAVLRFLAGEPVGE